MKYKVRVVESYSRTTIVEASSKQEACCKVEDMWNKGDVHAICRPEEHFEDFMVYVEKELPSE